MEAQIDPSWSKTLTDDEVARATRYAFWELNQLPSWLTSLYQARLNAEKEERITDFLENIWGNRSDSLNSQHRDFMNVETLTRLLTLTYATVRIEEDISHEGVYSPSPRDEAQRARGHLLQLLSGIRGERTFAALRKLATLQKGYLSDHLLNMAERRAEADVEREPWKTSDVASFAEEAERNPTTQGDLFEIGLSRLDDLKLEFEEGDESEAALLKKVDDEIELRRSLANRLRNMSQGKYTTGSEEELADITRTDIRLHSPNVDARIPIEVKIAGKWQAPVLRERLKNQLVGQYMREARYGIFLVVNRGAKGDLQTWNPSGKRVGFAELVHWLSRRAEALLTTRSNIDGLQVVGIDLAPTRRAQEAKGSCPKAARTAQIARREARAQAALRWRASSSLRQRRDAFPGFLACYVCRDQCFALCPIAYPLIRFVQGSYECATLAHSGCEGVRAC